MQILLAFLIFLIVLTGLEIYTIWMLADYIGSIWYALAVILITGIIGFVIARKNAKDALQNLMKGDFRNTPPARQIFDTIVFFFAAAFLLLPGLITDILGILLLLPLTRNIIYKKVSKGKIANHADNGFRKKQDSDSSYKRDNSLGADGVIDIEAEDV